MHIGNFLKNMGRFTTKTKTHNGGDLSRIQVEPGNIVASDGRGLVNVQLSTKELGKFEPFQIETNTWKKIHRDIGKRGFKARKVSGTVGKKGRLQLQSLDEDSVIEADVERNTKYPEWKGLFKPKSKKLGTVRFSSKTAGKVLSSLSSMANKEPGRVYPEPDQVELDIHEDTVIATLDRGDGVKVRGVWTCKVPEKPAKHEPPAKKRKKAKAKKA